jgi:hypothetical protein
MAFTDWIKNRNASQQPSVAENSQQQKPETAKEMYSREAAQEKAKAKPITPEIKAQADRVTATMDKATQHMQTPAAAAPAEGGTNSPHLQKQNRQDKTQAALSPTDDAAGKAAGQAKQPAPEKTPERAQTLPRPKPSWER